MVFGAFKSLFGGPPAPAAAATGPFGVGIGRALSLDLMRLRLEEKRLARGLPSDTLVITGHGVAELDATSTLHRYYDDAGGMLQVLCVGGGTGDDAIREVTVYHPWDEVVPTSDAEWATWDGPAGRIGAAVFEADGFRFERVWGEPSTPWVQPAQFTEAVTAEGAERNVLQRIVPYRREIGTAVEALILAVERDLATADRGSVTFMIGYGLQRSDVSPV